MKSKLGLITTISTHFSLEMCRIGQKFNVLDLKLDLKPFSSKEGRASYSHGVLGAVGVLSVCFQCPYKIDVEGGNPW